MELFADFCAVEGFFETAQNGTMAMQIAHGGFSGSQVKNFTGIIAENKNDGWNGILCDLIGLKGICHRIEPYFEGYGYRDAQKSVDGIYRDMRNANRRGVLRRK